MSEPLLRELVPSPGRAVDAGADVAAEERVGPAGRPWVFTNMVGSLDGGTAAADGVSGGLGNDADKAVFSALRSACDAIIVGAATARAERYRVPKPNNEGVRPRLTIVTGSLSLDDDLPLFDNPEHPPLIVTTTSAPADRRESLAARAEIVAVDGDRVTPAAVIVALAERGRRRLLLEGGPSLNGQFVAAGLVDEWNLSLAPMLLAGASDRAAVGPSLDEPEALRLVRLWQGGDHLFGRWVRD
ncbi:MAG: dihydrofolate reductase family protein [Acidimicrobiales bacterium]